MMLFKDYLDEKGVDYFIVEIPVNPIPKETLLNEGQWVESGKRDWMQRVERATNNPQLHVHIARSKHIKSKEMQASWNQDGTKHDKKSFNSKIGSLNVVQNIARNALDLSNAIQLQEIISTGKNLERLNESVDINIQPVMFRLIRI